MVRRLGAGQWLKQLARAMVTRAAEYRHEHMVLINDLKFLPALQQQVIKLAQARALEFVIVLLNDINATLMRRRREGATWARVWAQSKTPT